MSFQVHAKDLVTPPVYVRPTKTRKAPAKPPSWHLTSPETMKFIEEADLRQKEKELKQTKIENIKKEAVKEARKVERQERMAQKRASGPRASGPRVLFPKL